MNYPLFRNYRHELAVKFNPQDVIAAVEHATETVQAELVPYLSDSFGPDRYLPCGCHVAVQMNNSIENAAQSIKELRDAGVDLDALPKLKRERHRMPMPRIGSVPDPRGNFPFSKKAVAD